MRLQHHVRGIRRTEQRPSIVSPGSIRRGRRGGRRPWRRRSHYLPTPYSYGDSTPSRLKSTREKRPSGHSARVSRPSRFVSSRAKTGPSGSAPDPRRVQIVGAPAWLVRAAGRLEALRLTLGRTAPGFTSSPERTPSRFQSRFANDLSLPRHSARVMTPSLLRSRPDLWSSMPPCFPSARASPRVSRVPSPSPDRQKPRWQRSGTRP